MVIRLSVCRDSHYKSMTRIHIEWATVDRTVGSSTNSIMQFEVVCIWCADYYEAIHGCQ